LSESNRKPHYCKECRDHVEPAHRTERPDHKVFSFGAKLTKPRPEQFKFRLLYPPRTLPPELDLSSNFINGGFTQAFRQGEQGSCTANCGVADFIYRQIIGNAWNKQLYSRAFLYAATRIIEGTFPEDSGSMMETLGKVLGTQGICFDSTMPYTDRDCATKPNAQAIAEALQWTTDVKQTRLTWNETLQVLNELGPVRLGTPVPQSFTEAGPDGFIPVPDPDEPIVGGHAMLPLGYKKRKGPDDVVRLYRKVLNSWGSDFGDQQDPLNCIWMPDEYGQVYASDLDIWVQLDSKPGPGGSPTPQPTPAGLHLRLQRKNGSWKTLWQL